MSLPMSIEDARSYVSELAATPPFEKFKQLLLAENSVHNLTRIVDPVDFKVKNLEDSLIPFLISPYISDYLGDFFEKTSSKDFRMIDVGTGGGFPLFPLGLLFRALYKDSDFEPASFCGLDSVAKKMDALNRVALNLERDNLNEKASPFMFLCGRAEELGRDKEYRETFDLVTCRAVAQLSTALELCSSFAKPRAIVVAYKGQQASEELEAAENAIVQLSLTLVEDSRYSLSENMGERAVLVFKKTDRLDERYPRRTGIPTKRPL